MTRVLRFDQGAVRRVLPHRSSMQLLDRVASYSPEERGMVGLKSVGQGEPFAYAYLPAAPVFPPVLVVEALAQTCGFLMNLEFLVRHGVELARLRRAAIPLPAIPHSVLADSKVRHRSLASPGETLRLDARIVLQREQVYLFQVRAAVAEREVASGEITLAYPEYTGRR